MTAHQLLSTPAVINDSLQLYLTGVNVPRSIQSSVCQQLWAVQTCYKYWQQVLPSNFAKTPVKRKMHTSAIGNYFCRLFSGSSPVGVAAFFFTPAAANHMSYISISVALVQLTHHK